MYSNANAGMSTMVYGDYGTQQNHQGMSMPSSMLNPGPNIEEMWDSAPTNFEYVERSAGTFVN